MPSTLSGRGAGLDPCAAIQPSRIAPWRRTEVVYPGQAETAEDARAIALKYKQLPCPQARRTSCLPLGHFVEYRRSKTAGLVDGHMLNRWLVYQALSCRVGEIGPSISRAGLRISRSVCRTCVRLCTRGRASRANTPACGEHSSRGRCAALVASSKRSRRADTMFG